MQKRSMRNFYEEQYRKHERKMAEEQKKVEEIEAVKRSSVSNQKEWRQEGGRQYTNVAHRPMVAPKVFGPRQPNWNPPQHHQQKPFHQQIGVDKKRWNIYPKNQMKSRVAATDRQKYGPATKKMIPAVEKKKDKAENFLTDFQSKLRLKTAEEVAPLIVFDEPEKKEEAKDELTRMAEEEMKKVEYVDRLLGAGRKHLNALKLLAQADCNQPFSKPERIVDFILQRPHLYQVSKENGASRLDHGMRRINNAFLNHLAKSGQNGIDYEELKKQILEGTAGNALLPLISMDFDLFLQDLVGLVFFKEIKGESIVYTNSSMVERKTDGDLVLLPNVLHSH